MNTKNIQMRVQSAPWMNGLSLWIKDTRTGAQARDIEFQQMEEGIEVPALALLDLTAAQTLMDDLWSAGIRPAEGAGTAGSMRAVEAHLKDMRAIAFNQLTIEQP